MVFTNRNYVLLFIHFQLVNTVAIYNGEMVNFTRNYPKYGLGELTIASMLNCVAGILGSLLLGRLIDARKCFKAATIALPAIITGTILLTWVLLKSDADTILVLTLMSLAGAPLSSVSVASYQFVAEVTYPVNEVAGVGLMNTFNKLFTFGVVMLTSLIVEEELILWTCIAVLGLIPAILVKEDLRRLRLKDVQNSEYIEESTILK